MAVIPDKTIIFRKFDLWLPLLTSILTWVKKWPKWLRMGSLRDFERRIARPSSFPSFWVRQGVILPPPPPPWRRWLRPPPGRGLTRALLGLWIFHRLLGGGVWTPPPWSRLLVAVEKNERQRSKAREKSFRNHFGHFFAQVKIGVSRGQNSKIFQNGFSTIKSLILKIEQRIWYHRVCLVKACRTIYKMTLKGQGQSLTSGQVRPKSRDDRNGSYCISLDAPGQNERTDTNPTSLSLFDQKLLANDGWWPRVTSNDLWRGR